MSWLAPVRPLAFERAAIVLIEIEPFLLSAEYWWPVAFGAVIPSILRFYCLTSFKPFNRLDDTVRMCKWLMIWILFYWDPSDVRAGKAVGIMISLAPSMMKSKCPWISGVMVLYSIAQWWDMPMMIIFTLNFYVSVSLICIGVHASCHLIQFNSLIPHLLVATPVVSALDVRVAFESLCDTYWILKLVSSAPRWML